MSTPNVAPGASTQAVIENTKKVVDALMKRGGKVDCLAIFADLVYKARTLQTRDRSGFEKLALQWRTNLRTHGLEQVAAEIETLTKQRHSVVSDADIEKILAGPVESPKPEAKTDPKPTPRPSTNRVPFEGPVPDKSVDPIADFASGKKTSHAPPLSLPAAVAGLKLEPVKSQPELVSAEGDFRKSLDSVFSTIFAANEKQDAFRGNFPLSQFITAVTDPDGKKCLIVESVKGFSKELGKQVSIGVMTLKTHLDGKNKLTRHYREWQAPDRGFKRHLRAVNTFPGLAFRLYVQDVDAKRNIPEYNAYVAWNGQDIRQIDSVHFDKLCEAAADAGRENGLRK